MIIPVEGIPHPFPNRQTERIYSFCFIFSCLRFLIIVRFRGTLYVTILFTASGYGKADVTMKKDIQYTSPHNFYGLIPLKEALPLGIQHVLSMFVGNMTPLLLICGACEIGNSDPELFIVLLQNAMLVAGLVTLVQLYSIGPVGGKVPIVMGTSSSFLGIFQVIVEKSGGGILAYGLILGASIVGGLVEAVLGFFIKPLRKLFPPVVTGIVVLTIGLSLIPIGVQSFAGGMDSPDFGSVENVLIALAVMTVTILVKHFTKGTLHRSAVLAGILFGYVLCSLLAFILPTTGVAADGTVFTKAWVIPWDKVAEAKWISIPKLLPVQPVFRLNAILPLIPLFIVTSIETLGDTAGCVEGGMDREATDKELSGAVICDGLGSSFAALFGVLPNSSFSQNVGLVTMTKVVNRFALSTGALFLVLCGLCPKLAAMLSIMPGSVLGGAAILMFSSIALSGIQLINKDGFSQRIITIVSASLGLGFGFSAVAGATQGFGPAVSMLFSGSGIFPAAVVSVLLNLILPKDQNEPSQQPQNRNAE